MANNDDLTNLLVHDLRGPLSVIAATVNRLLIKTDRHETVPPEEERRLLDRVLRNARKAQSLVDEMLEICQSQENLFCNEPFPVLEMLKESLREALDTAVPHLSGDILDLEDSPDPGVCLQAHGVFIEISGKYESTPFCHDRRKVQQILRNLMSNALKFRRKHMHVHISGDHELCICVEDDGAGIPQEEKESIFKRFVRLKDKKHEGIPGLGLGLAGVKVIVEKMRGEIKLESRKEGGTRFTVLIPPLSSE